MASAQKDEKDLQALEREFRNWRRQRRRGARIPEPLWARAVALVRTHGAWKTTKRLGLNSEALKKRCRAAAKAGAMPEAKFVELPLAEVVRGPVPDRGEAVVELEDASGARLRVVLPRAKPAEVAAVARGLWSARL